MTLARTADAAAEPGVTADLFAVLEPGPVTEFGDEHAEGERTQTFGPNLWGQGLDLLGEGVQLFLDGGNKFAPDLQPWLQPIRQDEGLRPPFPAQPDALGQPETAALGGQPLPFAPELFPLATSRPAVVLPPPWARGRHS
jgi:hypothetical protein